jgi:2-polyprenyl-3-methyl-5-hydroxy-6-metoxy-1,4-benzoquinol methylase
VRIKANLRFLNRMLYKRLTWQDTRCPYCNQPNTSIIGRKHLVLQLRRCTSCKLMFRWPKDTAEHSQCFYQAEYREAAVTELPDEASLKLMQEFGFRGTERDITDKIAILKQLASSGLVMDYGCSWGYGTVQLQAAGYETIGFEISQPRATFGRSRLGLRILSSEAQLDGLTGSFDVVFASHVLEHVPAPSLVLDRIASLLKQNGWLLGFVPNCGGDNARKLGVKWGPMCCEKHPLALDAEFLEQALRRRGFDVYLSTSPYAMDVVREIFNPSRRGRDLDGVELMICARKTSAYEHTEMVREA